MSTLRCSSCFVLALLGALAVTGCGSDKTQPAAAGKNAAVADILPPATPSAAPRRPTADRAAVLSGRDGELVAPKESDVVFLYYDVAGIAAPIQQWVEDDFRLGIATAPDKAGVRAAIRAELSSAAEAVRGVGSIRLSVHDANLSAYDPTYGEFTIRALSPSSSFPFTAFGQTVMVKPDNGSTAQIWKATPEEAQVVRDKLGTLGGATLDVQMVVTGAVPGPRGGTLTARIVGYELRSRNSGATLVRARL